MKILLALTFALAAALTMSTSVRAQASDCPADKVCVSREAYIRLLQRDDLATAQAAEIAVLKESIDGKDGYKSIVSDLKIAVAGFKGELTGCQQNNVDLRTTNTELIKGYKARHKIGLINF